LTIPQSLLQAGWVLLIGILLLNVWRTTADGFVRWPADLETRLRYQSVIQDMARYWETQGSGAPVLAELFFEPIDLDTFRRNVSKPTAARWVQSADGLAGAIVWPGGSSAAQLYVPEYAPLDPGLMEFVGIPTEPVYRSTAVPSFAVYRLPPEPSLPLEPTAAQFNESLTLLGYAVLPVEDGQLPLITYWQVDGPLSADLSLFVHILDPEGQIAAQHDGLDAAAVTLKPGDRFLQRHLLPLTANMTGNEDEYTIQAGAYTRVDGRRLPVTNCASPGVSCTVPMADAVLLATGDLRLAGGN
jgi:hypothetical protein